MHLLNGLYCSYAFGLYLKPCLNRSETIFSLLDKTAKYNNGIV